MAIMKKTLEQMGYSFTEAGETLKLSSGRYDITVDGKKGRINFDSEDRKLINTISQNYQVNFFRDQAIREGNKVTQEQMADGRIILHVSH